MARISAVTLGFLLLLALLARPVWLGREQWHIGQGTDDGVYLVTAKAIATGHGVRVTSLPGAPYAVKYPPLYPAFLSIAWLIRPDFPASARVGALLQALLLPIFLVLLLAVLRRFGFSWRRTFLVAALTVVSMQVVLLAIMLFSELLCMCLLLAAILAVERSLDTDQRNPVSWALASGLLAGLAYLTRNAALPLLAAAPLYFAMKKRPRLAVYFLLTALPFAAGWHLWTFTHAPSGPDATNGSYLDEYVRMIRMNGFWANFVRQLGELSSGVADSLAPRSLGFLGGLPLYHIVLAAAIAGCIRIGLRCRWPLYLIFSGLNCVMMLFWWSEGILRLTVLAWPALVAGVAEELAHVAWLFEKTFEKTPERSPFWSHHSSVWRAVPRWALIGLGLATIFRNEHFASNFVATTMAEERRMRMEDERVFSWIASHATPSTVVLAWKDTTSFLYTRAVASRSLFIAVTPQTPQMKSFAASFADLPPVYTRGLLLILRSDLGNGLTDRDLEPFKAAGESLPGSHLEFSSTGAFIYSFPLPR